MISAAAVGVLWQRDLRRFFRQRSRVIGALVQPLIFWLVIGSGLNRSFILNAEGAPDYRAYFFPGVIVMVVLFTSIFSTMSLIEDRHAGFLQAVLVAPATRLSIVLGKVLGGATVAMLQTGLFLLLAPFAGYSYAAIDWPMLGAILLVTAIGLTSLGFFLAWFLDSTQGYHAVMSVALIPMWILSGAMFPVEGDSKILTVLMRANPMTYAVEGVHRALSGGTVPAGVGVPGSSAALDFAVISAFAVVTLAASAWACRRRA